MIRNFKSVVRSFKKTKVLNSNSLYLQYNLSRIEKNITQLLGELNINVHIENRNIARATELDLGVLLCRLEADIEKKRIIEIGLAAPGLIIAVAITGIDMLQLLLVVFSIIGLLIFYELHHINKIERLVLSKELLKLYMKLKFRG